MFAKYYKIFNEEPKPFAFVDLDAFDVNFKTLKARCGNHQIRIATKSIRSVPMLERLRDYFGISRWMCFSLEEALWLSDLGFDNIMVAYPTLQKVWVEKLCEKLAAGKTIYLTADSPYQLQKLQDYGEEFGTVISISMDLDVSTKFPGVYFGVFRSSLHSINLAEKFIKFIKNSSHLSLKGVMAYDAQIAGVGDAIKGSHINHIIRFLKKRSIPQIAEKCHQVSNLISKNNIQLDFFNAGGTGSLEYVAGNSGVTELTFGSGLYHPTLFDAYSNFSGKPAAGFVVEVCRNPQQNIYTALGCGYIASGQTGVQKQPSIVFPENAQLFKNEGCGEVQTPFCTASEMNLDETNFAVFRHAKAGELCERFNELLLLSNGEIAGKAFTYRGEGKCFL